MVAVVVPKYRGKVMTVSPMWGARITEVLLPPQQTLLKQNWHILSQDRLIRTDAWLKVNRNIRLELMLPCYLSRTSVLQHRTNVGEAIMIGSDLGSD